MQTNSRQEFWTLTTFGAWILLSVVITSSCGGKTASDVVTREAANADGNVRPLEGDCVDAVFVAALEEATGIVVCPSNEPPFLRDSFSKHAVACDGRGSGSGPTIISVCDSDAECPVGDTCFNRLCRAPVECDNDSGCAPQEACACASAFATGSATGYNYASAIGFNQCVPAECRSDSDCNGYPCGLSDKAERCADRQAGFFCHSSNDECTQSSDCDTPANCIYEPSSQRWTCRPYHEVVCR
jgi:hypothetical protein